MSIEEIIERSNLTVFQKKVYQALLLVPKGHTISYGELARRIGCGSAQAVGQALKRNPFAVGERYFIGDTEIMFTTDFCVPCHRVIASDGSIGGFHGQQQGPQISRKRQLLQIEKK